MLRVFNTSVLTEKQNFGNAVLFGALASIACWGAFILANKLMMAINIDFSIVYVGIGWAIGTVIQKTGNGVQIHFSILAAVFCLLVILFGDMFTFGVSVSTMIEIYINSLSNILSLIFRLAGIVTAFFTARVL